MKTYMYDGGSGPGGDGGSGSSSSSSSSVSIGGGVGGAYVGEALPQGAPFLIFDPLIKKITERDFHFNVTFPRSAWQPDLFGAIALAEFGETDWRSIDDFKKPPQHRHAIMLEIETLIGMARDERRGLGAEILDQNSRVKAYFTQVLMMSAWSHPSTLKLIEMAYRVAQMLGVHFKLKYNRARPQQIFPPLIPLINSPWHASFPSAHSLESHMIANALAAASPGAAKPLRALANRIGRNREVAGVHYPSDTRAGRQIADEAFNKHLLNCPTFKKVLHQAKDHEPQVALYDQDAHDGNQEDDAS